MGFKTIFQFNKKMAIIADKMDVSLKRSVGTSEVESGLTVLNELLKSASKGN